MKQPARYRIDRTRTEISLVEVYWRDSHVSGVFVLGHGMVPVDCSIGRNEFRQHLRIGYHDQDDPRRSTTFLEQEPER